MIAFHVTRNLNHVRCNSLAYYCMSTFVRRNLTKGGIMGINVSQSNRMSQNPESRTDYGFTGSRVRMRSRLGGLI